MKRPREEEQEGAEQGAQQGEEAPAAPAAPGAGSGGEPPAGATAAAGAAAAPGAAEDEDDKPLLANFKMSRAVRKGHECPYLDTISRQVRLCVQLQTFAAARAGRDRGPAAALAGSTGTQHVSAAIGRRESVAGGGRWRPAARALQGGSAPHRALCRVSADLAGSPALPPQNLDFDFEKCCSVTLSKNNVYVCLVCGKYFQASRGGVRGRRRAAR